MNEKDKKPEAKAKSLKSVTKLDWLKIGTAVEADLKNRGWKPELHRRNPRLIFGVVSKLVISEIIKHYKE